MRVLDIIQYSKIVFNSGWALLYSEKFSRLKSNGRYRIIMYWVTFLLIQTSLRWTRWTRQPEVPNTPFSPLERSSHKTRRACTSSNFGLHTLSHQMWESTNQPSEHTLKLRTNHGSGSFIEKISYFVLPHSIDFPWICSVRYKDAA